MFLSLVLFSLLALILEPGLISFIGLSLESGCQGLVGIPVSFGSFNLHMQSTGALWPDAMHTVTHACCVSREDVRCGVVWNDPENLSSLHFDVSIQFR